jgi:two-component system, OmpR family, phosphate regulon sensor histidine kinase PhoR
MPSSNPATLHPRTAQRDEATLRAVALARRLQGLEQVRKSFISEASHELNTPLTPLRIHVDALRQRSDLNDAQRAHLEVIDRNTKRLCAVVEGLLEVARTESDRLVLDLADLPLSVAIRAAVSKMAPAAAEAGVMLEVTPPRGNLVA